MVSPPIFAALFRAIRASSLVNVSMGLAIPKAFEVIETFDCPSFLQVDISVGPKTRTF